MANSVFNPTATAAINDGIPIGALPVNSANNGIPLSASNEAVASWLQSNPGMSDATIAAAMNQYGVTPAQMAAVTGLDLGAVQSRYDAAMAPLSLQSTSNTAGNTGGANTNVLGGLIIAGDSFLSNPANTSIIGSQTGQDVTNVAVGGYTTNNVITQLDNFINSGGTFAPGSTVMLNIGGNDLLQGADSVTVRNNLDQIISTLEDLNVNVILSGASDVGSVEDVTGSTNLVMNGIYNDVAANHSNVTLVDSMSGLLNQKNLVDDTGFHLNTAGQTAFNAALSNAYLNSIGKGNIDYTEQAIRDFVTANGLSLEEALALAPSFSVSADKVRSALAQGDTGATSNLGALSQVANTSGLGTTGIGTSDAANALTADKAPTGALNQVSSNVPENFNASGTYNAFVDNLKNKDVNPVDAVKSLNVSEDLKQNTLNIYNEILQQQSAGTENNWGTGTLASKQAAAAEMAWRLAEGGAKSLQDIGVRQVDRTWEDGEGGIHTYKEPEYFSKSTGELVNYNQNSGGLKLNYHIHTLSDGTVVPIATKRRSDWMNFREDTLKPAVSLFGSFIPGAAPFIAAGNAINAANKGDWGTAIVSALGAVPGFNTALNFSPETLSTLSTARTAGQVINAIDKGNPIALANALMQTDTGKTILSTDMGNGITMGDVVNTAKIVKLADDGNYAEALTAAGQLTNSPNLAIAASAINFGEAIKSGDPFKVLNAAGQLNSVVRSADTTSQTGDLGNRVYDDTITQAGVDAAGTLPGTTTTGPLTTAGDATAGNGVVITPIDAGGPNTSIITNAATGAADTEWGDLAGAQTAATARNTVNIGSTEAKDVNEAAALAQARDPSATRFTFGGDTYNFTGSNAQVRAAALEGEISNAPSRSEAFRIARAGGLGANDTFTWNGKVYSAATAEERPDLAGTKTTTTPGFTPTVSNYVSDKLAQNLSDPNFNPADLTRSEMSQFVSAYANATPAQQQAMLRGADQATFRVIDSMLRETTAVNPTGKVTNVAPAGSTTLKAYDKPFLSVALDVGKGAAGSVATDIAGLGVRGAQFLGDLMGQDTEALSQVQNLLADRKDTEMSRLVGNEKVVAGGIASGVQSAMSWALGGPLASVALNAATVANNTWVEGANKWISDKGDVFSSKEEARSQGVTDVRKLTPEENGMRTAAMTALETVGEMLGIPGMRTIMKGIPIGGTPGQIVNSVKNAALGLGNEQLSELATTVAQFSVDKFADFGLNKNASFDDFKQALQDTVLATTAAVGSASGIATAYNSAAGRNTGAITEADRTAVTPDLNTSLLTRGADFGAKPGDTSNQGLNPISSEAVEFLAQSPESQRTILDGIKNQFASATLAASMALGTGANAADAMIQSGTPTTITAPASGVPTASFAASTSIANDLSNNVNLSTAFNNALSNVGGTNTNVLSATSAAVNTALQNNANPTSVVASAIPAAVQAGGNIDNVISAVVQQTVKTGASPANVVQSAVDAAVLLGMNPNAALQVAMNAATPTTTAPTTAAPTNTAPTTVTPTNTAPATAIPATTPTAVAPTNVAPTTVIPTTVAPTTVTPTTTTPVVTTPPVVPTVGTPETLLTSVVPPDTPVVPPVVKPPVVKTPPTKPSDIKQPPSQRGVPRFFGDAEITTTPQFLKGAPKEKAMQLAALRQLYDSLTPEMQEIFAERGITMPDEVDEKSEKDSDDSREKRDDKNRNKKDADLTYEELMAEQDANLTPAQLAEKYSTRSNEEGVTTRFFATGGAISEIKDRFNPNLKTVAQHLAAAPVTNESPLRLMAIKHLREGIAKPPRSMSGLAQGGLPHKYAKAAPEGHNPEFITGLTGYYASGKGTGQSDDIPAMLHDGDYVIDADAVAALGDGSSKAGAQALSQFQSKVPHKMSSGGPAVPAKIADGEYVFPEAFVTALGGGDNKQGAKMLDAMREELRAHKRSAPTSKIPPKAKSPLDYLRMAKG